MKKKVIAMLLTSVLAVSMFAGCGSDEGTDSAADTQSSSQDSADEEEASDEESAAPDTTYGTATEGKFVVGFDQEFPPMGFVGEDGEYTGFDLELAEEVANRLGLEIGTETTWGQLLDMVPALEEKAPDTVCGYVRNIGRPGEEAHTCTLAELGAVPADMFTTVFVGNRQTKLLQGKMVTPRGYFQRGE